MNNKLKAATFVALYTVGLVLAIGSIQIILNYLQPTLAEVGVGFAVLMLAYAMKMMYVFECMEVCGYDTEFHHHLPKLFPHA